MARKYALSFENELDSFPIKEIIDNNPQFSRRQILAISGIASISALSSPTFAKLKSSQGKRPRIAVLVSYWAATRSHADWIVTKLIDGYWWNSEYTPSRVEVASIYMHQHDASLLGQKVAKAKGIPTFKTVNEALTLGTNKLAVDGVVIVAEHGDYATDLKGHWLLPRWWIYNQVVNVFEKSKRSVPVFNDKHLSYNWDDAKWMFDKSRELNFPLSGGSSIPIYYRQPEIELEMGSPIKHSIVLGGTSDEGAIFHAIDVLQSFVELRKGGETGIKSVQSIRGSETWKWIDENPWVNKLLAFVEKKFNFSPGYFQEAKQTNMCIVNYNDGTIAAVIGARGVGWTYAADIEGKPEPTIVSMLGWAGPFDQYHASNAQPHWITEMMVNKKEPFNAERLLLSTGITNFYMQSNWKGSKYSAVGRVIETPELDIRYKTNRGAQFSKGARPPARPYIRGFDQ